MPKPEIEKVRLNVELDRDLYMQLRQRLPWGTKSEVVRELLIMLIQKIEDVEDPVLVVKTLVQGRYNLVEQDK